MQKTFFVSALLSAFLLVTSAALADDYAITLKDHQFTPKELSVPANQKIKLVIKNLDATAAEFESSDLEREKVVPANGQISIFIGPLDAGSYGYFDDFHHDTTTGTIVAK